MFITINNKEYKVTRWPDGSFSISAIYETIVPSTVSLAPAHQQKIVVSRSVGIHGRLGKKILEEFKRRQS